MASEFDIIARYFSFAAAGSGGVVLGVGDDAALLQAGSEQVMVATDTLVAGMHFPAAASPERIASRALAVNLSDFAAMGAIPRWLCLALTLPDNDENWLQAFASALANGCAQYNVALVGGDTTRGPLTISLTVLGQLPAHALSCLRRDAAKPGDDVWVSGALGAGAAALSLLEPAAAKSAAWRPTAAQAQQLEQHFYAPEPRLALGQALVGCAHAAIDISDGLLADAGHIAAASDVQLVLRGDDLPIHEALATLENKQQLQPWVLAGGDDYELLFTAARDQRSKIEAISEQLGIRCSLVGSAQAGSGVILQGANWTMPAATGFQHF
ncbi:MAG: thiamine-phosphate kinase [Gammaproteobacteria bacterium]|nr:thiamine-phosphate kinase [Gammaproteobacteria bacterium]